MKDKITIVYCTANREDESFENKCRDILVKNSNGLPIISVSQKPLDFGKNICVGWHDACDHNQFRQTLMGIEEAKTEFILIAESDCLYPPEYFSFIPPTKNHCYRYSNLWVMWKWIGIVSKGLYWRKRFSDCAQICGREFYLKSLGKIFEGRPVWGKSGETQFPHAFESGVDYYWETQNPVLNIKTEASQRSRTGIMKEIKPVNYLPYWGKAQTLREKLFKEELYNQSR